MNKGLKLKPFCVQDTDENETVQDEPLVDRKNSILTEYSRNIITWAMSILINCTCGYQIIINQ